MTKWQPDINKAGLVENAVLPCVRDERLVCRVRTDPGARFECVFRLPCQLSKARPQAKLV